MTAVERIVVLVALAASGAGPASHAAALQQAVAGVEIDWAAGVVTASAGSAADYRLPSAQVARPGAERRARAAALGKMRAALAGLPVGPGRILAADKIDQALRRVETGSISYQSNGGVLLSLKLSFAALTGGDADKADDPATVLSVASAPLELAPVLVVQSVERSVRYAVYREGAAPSGVRALLGRRDQMGRLIVDGGLDPDKVASGHVVIYVQKVLR